MSMTLIEHIEVGSGGASEIEFASIPQTYTDLMIVVSGRSTNTGTNWDKLQIKLNSSTANFTTIDLFGFGSSGGNSSSEVVADMGFMSAANNTADTFGNASIYIPNYTSSAAKSISADAVSENNATEAYQQITAGLWDVTNAITNVQIYAPSGNLVQYSSATLYGITAGSDGTTTVS